MRVVHLSWIIAIVLLGVTSCYVTMPKYESDGTGLTPREARKSVPEDCKLLYVCRDQSCGGGDLVESCEVFPDRVELISEGKARYVVRLSTINLDVKCEIISMCRYDLDERTFLYDGAVAGKRQKLMRLADAISVLKRASTGQLQTDGADLSRFEQEARKYRDAKSKPQMSEEVRRLRVQAEAAVRNKNFQDAADFYEDALALAPWWPEGHFNRALVLGEVGDFSPAISEMKRYLLLVPNASDARAAQDKIYEWEGKIKK